MRIVSHTCSNTEILCALGLAEQIVGVDDHSDYPAQVVESVAKVGPDLSIDIDRIKALKPDLVVTSLTVPGHEQCLQALQDADLPILVTEPKCLLDVADDMQTIANAAGIPQKGREIAQVFRDRLAEFKAEQEQNTRPPVSIAVEWWPKPVIVPAKDSWVNQMLELAGAYNPWHQKTGTSLIIEPAQAQLIDPEAVVMSWCGVKESKYHPHVVAQREGWSTVSAIQRQHIYPISEAYLGRPGPRLIQGIERLQAVVEHVRSQPTGG